MFCAPKNVYIFTASNGRGGGVIVVTVISLLDNIISLVPCNNSIVKVPEVIFLLALFISLAGVGG